MTTKAEVQSGARALRDALFDRSQDGRFSNEERSRLGVLNLGVSSALQDFSARPGTSAKFPGAEDSCDSAKSKVDALTPRNESQLGEVETATNEAIDALKGASGT